MRRRLFLAAAGAAAVSPAAADGLDVAILGGGLAGLTAARALIAANKKVLVIEARDRIGGRTFTDTSLGLAFDTGATWIAPGPLAKELGGKPVPGPQQEAVVLGGTPLTAERLVQYGKSLQAMAATLKEVHDKAPGVDPRQVLHPNVPADQLAYFQLTHKPPFEMHQSLEGGIGAAVARLGARVPVKLGTQVLRIDSTNPAIEIVTTTGTVLARSVIVTVPVSVLGGGHFGFAPPLRPNKREAIASFTMASSLRIAVAFSQAVPKAPADSLLTGISVSGQPFQALVRPQDRNAAIVVLSDEAARQVEEQGPSAAGAFALSTLAEVYGKELRAAFKGAVASRWGRDPLAAGAWCVGAKGAAAVLAAPHNERIFFAGEATEEGAGTIEAGPLQAAWASGLRAAGEAKALLR